MKPINPNEHVDIPTVAGESLVMPALIGFYDKVRNS